jgi:twinkle protein
MIEVEYAALEKRGLTEETCRLWNYGIGEHHGQPVQVALYRDASGEAVAQKVRTADKQFRILGDASRMVLFGQHRFSGQGRMVVVTEGEIDAMSLSQVQEHKWPVVSVPNGAQSAPKAVAKSLDWLEGFDRVVFAFDMDEPGQKAAKECARVLSPGKAFIANLPLKDANDCIRNGKAKDLVNAMWNAPAYRPDGIVAAQDIWERIESFDASPGIAYPWSPLTGMLHGIRPGELVTVTAGTGVGKSQFCRELAYHLIKSGTPVGYIALEESVARTAIGLMSLEANRRLHLGANKDELKDSFDRVFGSNRVYLYDHFGSTEGQNLLDRIRYMGKGLGCKAVFLDHISIAVSGLNDGHGDERRMLDALVTKLRTLVEETQITLFMVCHLKRVDGRSHEEGGEVSLSHLRSSQGIAQLSDAVIALERNQQGENRNQTRVRVLKCRYTGETGPCLALEYDKETGRMSECPMFDPADGSKEEDAEIPF